MGYQLEKAWVLTFCGLDLDGGKPLTLCYSTRYAALRDFQTICGRLRKAHPGEKWSEDADGIENLGKVSFSMSSENHPEVFAEAKRARLCKGTVFCEGGISSWEGAPADLGRWAQGHNN